MTLAEDLFLHAVHLAAQEESDTWGNVNLRRAVSASYYALFHLIIEYAVKKIAPDVSNATSNEIHRWFDHAEMKRVCQRFIPDKLDRPLAKLIGGHAADELRIVSRSFVQLQEARHRADYDPGYDLDSDQTRQLVRLAFDARTAWIKIAGTEEANIFVLALLLWKKWDRDRP